MLKKLLKYDFRAVFKYWWIAAVTSLALSVLGGFCIRLLTSGRELPGVMYIFPTLSLVLVVIGYVAFMLLSLIWVYVRFYKNFYTDEGYLTFTLPVKRVQLLNSKLIMSVTTSMATGVVLVLSVLVMLGIGTSDQSFVREFVRNFQELRNMLGQELGWYMGLYAIESILFMILSASFATLFIFCCITFASIITKKAKILCAIAIYYVANGIMSFFIQMFTVFGLQSIMTWLQKLPDTGGGEKPVLALIFLVALLFMALFNALLYTLQYWMMDRKLNLS